MSTRSVSQKIAALGHGRRSHRQESVERPGKAPRGVEKVNNRSAVAQNKKGFLTPNSLTNFSVSSCLVIAMWAVARRYFIWGQSSWVPLVLSFLVGAVIFLDSVDNPQTAPKTKARWAIAIMVGCLNSLLLCASALGILGKGGLLN